MSNLGPASVTTVNTGLAQQTFNAPNTAAFPVTANTLRCVAASRATPLSATGDIPVALNNLGTFVPTSVIVTNGLVNGVSASVAAATLSINAGPGVTGTSLRASGVLTGQTSSTVATVSAAATTNVAINAQSLTTPGTIYINLTVAVAGGTVDIFVYGYDLT